MRVATTASRGGGVQGNSGIGFIFVASADASDPAALVARDCAW